MPSDHFDEIPNLIVNELASFSGLRLDSFEQEDFIEYLLRGICQLALKYAKGVEWYSEYIQNDDLVGSFSNHVQRINSQLFRVRHQIQHLSQFKSEVMRRGQANSETLYKTSAQNELLVASIQPLIQGIFALIEGTKFESIKERYRLQTRYRNKADLKVLSRLLSCEASFVASRDFSIYQSEATDAPKRRIETANLLPSAENSPFAE